MASNLPPPPSPSRLPLPPVLTPPGDMQILLPEDDLTELRQLTKKSKDISTALIFMLFMPLLFPIVLVVSVHLLRQRRKLAEREKIAGLIAGLNAKPVDELKAMSRQPGHAGVLAAFVASGDAVKRPLRIAVVAVLAGPLVLFVLYKAACA